MQQRVWSGIVTLASMLSAAALTAAAENPKQGLNLERLRAADANRDGALSPDELGESLWKRVSSFDANADGKLDAVELTALAAVKGRDTNQRGRPGGANASFTIHEHPASHGRTIRYSLYVPPDNPQALPLVLCLHGAGGNTAAANLLANPVAQKKHPCVVLAPACEARGARWVESAFRGKERQQSVMPELMEMLDAVIRDTHADPARIYITGQSMGGIGTWGLIVAHPDRFAAAVPVCGTWIPDDAKKISQISIWAFHGAKDPTVPVDGTRRMIEAIKAAGGSPKYTEFPNVGHGSWDAAYSTPELWEWLFQQKR